VPHEHLLGAVGAMRRTLEIMREILGRSLA
jgi:hypothetical protein